MKNFFSILLVIIQVIMGFLTGGINPPDGGSGTKLDAKVYEDSRTFTKFTQMKAYVFDNGEVKMHFRLAPPVNKKAGTKYPLVVYLHGSGDRGTDNNSHILALALNGPKNYGGNCYVFMPQIDTNYTWDDASIDTALNQCIDEYLLKNHSIDSKRIYLAGISMGGNGVLTQIYKHPTKYAAAACASGYFYFFGLGGVNYSPFVGTNLWMSHNSGDPVVPVSSARNLYNGVKALGGKKIFYTEYNSDEHNSWNAFFKKQDLWAWMFSKSLA